MSRLPWHFQSTMSRGCEASYPALQLTTTSVPHLARPLAVVERRAAATATATPPRDVQALRRGRPWAAPPTSFTVPLLRTGLGCVSSPRESVTNRGEPPSDDCRARAVAHGLRGVIYGRCLQLRRSLLHR